MLKFLPLKPKAFGLDLSDLSLKITKLKKKGKFLCLDSWGETEIKPGIIEDGEIKNEAALTEIIKEGLSKVKGKKIKIREVVTSLPEKKAFLQVIQMPKMEEGELKKAIPFEAENYIPLPIEEVYLDFQIVPPVYDHLDHFDILIAAIPKETTYPYVSCLKKAGLLPQALEIESQSISRALIKNGVSPFPIAIIDFGRSRASFIIFSGYSLRFTSSIPISSQKLTEAISQTLKVNLTEAEKLKLKYGLKMPEKNAKYKGISEAMIPLLTDLARQIKKYLRYYQTHAGHEHLEPDSSGRASRPISETSKKKIEKILLCGRGANLKGLADFLSSELKISVKPGNPWINILSEPLKEVPELSFEESLGYTTVLGLTLRGVKGEYDKFTTL